MLISMEGPEGSGKSTQARILAASLDDIHPTVLTREPGGTQLGERIRSAILAEHDTPASAVAELLLFSAARAQLVHEVILPALARGALVICDRYTDSTRAYQGGGLGLRSNVVEDAIRLATGGLEPDLTLYLDIPPREGLQRRRGMDAAADVSWNSFDARSLEFHERVRAEYLRLLSRYPERIIQVDAARPVAEVAAEILGVVTSRLAGSPMGLVKAE